VSQFKPSSGKRTTSVVCMVVYNAIQRPPERPIYQPRHRSRFVSLSFLATALTGTVLACYGIGNFFIRSGQDAWPTVLNQAGLPPACPAFQAREDLTSLDGTRTYATCTNHSGQTRLRWFTEGSILHWIVEDEEQTYLGLESLLRLRLGTGVTFFNSRFPTPLRFVHDRQERRVCAWAGGILYGCEVNSYLYVDWPEAVRAQKELDGLKALRDSAPTFNNNTSWSLP
jgi:hypothetical protein